MKLRHFLCFLGTLVLLLSCSQSGIIRTQVPSRPAGQQDMIQFAAEPIPDVGIGVVGLGMRGGDAVERLSFVPGCHVAAVCDVESERAQASLRYLEGKGAFKLYDRNVVILSVATKIDNK